MSYSSKFTGKQIEDILDDVANKAYIEQLSSETDRAIRAELELSNSVVSLTGTTDELSNAITLEQDRAISKEQLLENTINDVSTSITNNIVALDSKLSQEIAAEQVRAKAAEEVNATAISAEQNRAQAKEQALQQAIDTLNGTTDGSVHKAVADGISSVIASAPEDFDTLKEISDYIASDKTNAANINNQLSELNTKTTTIETDVNTIKSNYVSKQYFDESIGNIDVTGKYKSSIEDKTTQVQTAVGGISKGTTVSQLEGQTIDSIFDQMLFPTTYPTFTAPSASISLKNYSSIVEVGVAAPTASNFTTSFSKGQITLNGSKQNDRSGNLKESSSFIYLGGNTSNTTLPTTVSVGNTSYQYHAEYEAGPQPKDSKGNDYGSPLSAGSVNSSSVTVNGTYPWYASTSSATSSNPVVKQSLVSWNTTSGSMSTGNFEVQPSGTLPQVFKLPRQLNTLQMLNTVSGNMETTSKSAYTETTETITINGTSRTYYVYTYNGATRGSVTLKATF